MSSSLSEINVVPLVDVMLVLLIIFMVTAPMMQQGLAVNLPTSRRSSPVSAQPIYVTVPAAFASTQRLMLDKEELGLDALTERIRQAMLVREDKSVFLRLDKTVMAQEIISVTDRLKDAGVEKIGISTQPPTGR